MSNKLSEWCAEGNICAKSRLNGSYYSQCSWNCECDQSRGLFCNNSICVCDST